MAAAIFREWDAFDVLHHEKWRAVGRCVCVVEPCDPRMIQLRKSALLGGESRAARGREPRITQHFNRNAAAKVGALAKKHHAHAAFAKFADDAVSAKFLASRKNRQGRCSGYGRPPWPMSRSSSESPLASASSSAKTSSANAASRSQRDSTNARCCAGGDTRRFVKDGLNFLPARAVH